MAELTPILYIPHGGGPLPLLGDPEHAGLTTFLSAIGNRFEKPSAILVISAHWEESLPTLTASPQPTLLYDYYGFPPESYEIKYPAVGDIALTRRVAKLLESCQMPHQLDDQRGFDHGMFVPLKLMYPDADIPCVQLSLLKGLNPEKHIQLGQALTELRREGVLILGSGLSFHNLKYIFSGDQSLGRDEAESFDAWLNSICVNDEVLSMEDRCEKLIAWKQAPGAKVCHPREEHLLPLHVCFGASLQDSSTAQNVFNERLFGRRVSAFLWQN